MASKQTIINQIQVLSEQFKAKPYDVDGWVFILEDSIDHREEQLRLGFTQGVNESEAFHKAHPSSEFDYLGEDYYVFTFKQELNII